MPTERIIICQKCGEQFDYHGNLDDLVKKADSEKECLLVKENCEFNKDNREM